MSVVASDIVVYGSLFMPEDDVTNDIGGGIDLLTELVFTDIDVPGTVEVISDDNSDTTQEITIVGRSASGVIKTTAVTLNGTTVVPVGQTFERFLKVTLDGSAVGNVTLRKTGNSGDLFVIKPGILTIRKPFYNISSDTAGGAERKFYEKIFIRNNHTTLALTDAQIVEQGDPASNIAFSLESVLNGSDRNGSGNTRLVAPGGHTFDSTTKNVSNNQEHDPLSAQGIWMEITLAAGEAPAKNTYTLRETGKTT
jgi:hypothetical protein